MERRRRPMNVSRNDHASSLVMGVPGDIHCRSRQSRHLQCRSLLSNLLRESIQPSVYISGHQWLITSSFCVNLCDLWADSSPAQASTHP